jgi:protein-disulfide isomerase
LDPPIGPDDHVTGPDDAPHLLVMYGDFECPYCTAAQSMLRRVRERMGDELRFAFRHFPIEDKHPHARHAAEASEAAAAQGAFWAMHDALYAARGHLADDDLERIATDLGLDGARLAREVAAGTHAARVDRDLASGRASGVMGTPAFFADGRLHADAFDARSLVDALRASG